MHNLLLKTVALELENTLFDSQMVAELKHLTLLYLGCCHHMKSLKP